MRFEPAEALRRAGAADHGVLATLHPERGADLVPVCFAIVGEVVAIPIDRVKSKSTTELGRLQNLEADPRAALLLEHWDPADWTGLWWVRLSLQRSREDSELEVSLEQALRDRYPQYREVAFAQILTFQIQGVASWAAD